MNLFNLFNFFALNTGAETAEKISQEVILNPHRLLEGPLKHMGIGMLSIFIVIGVIILCVYALNKIMLTLEERKANKQSDDQQ